MTKPNQEELQQHYNALLDSLAVIENLKDSTRAIDSEATFRNQCHIKIMLGKGWFDEGFDLTPFQSVLDGF
jgi:hypothetical protein